jgi:hypothetical protein
MFTESDSFCFELALLVLLGFCCSLFVGRVRGCG